MRVKSSAALFAALIVLLSYALVFAEGWLINAVIARP